MSVVLIPSIVLLQLTAAGSSDKLVTGPPKLYSPLNFTLSNLTLAVPVKSIAPVERNTVRLPISMLFGLLELVKSASANPVDV